MIHIRFLDHCVHRIFYVASREFVECVFLPDGFEVKIRPQDFRFQEAEISAMGYCFRGIMKIFVKWDGEKAVSSLRILIHFAFATRNDVGLRLSSEVVDSRNVCFGGEIGIFRNFGVQNCASQFVLKRGNGRRGFLP